MRLDVALLPSLVKQPERQVCIVVDVIRASTTIVTLLVRGCPAVHVARTLEAGRAFARQHGMLLCGERGGARPEGFDYGNSPTEFSTLDAGGRPAVLCTTNGTVALHRVASAPAVFVGCLANATAVVTAALTAAGEIGQVTVVCAGREGRFALDDAWCAGALVRRASELCDSPTLTDAGRAAIALTDALPDAHLALVASGSAQALVPLGLEADVAFVAVSDRYSVAPRLTPDPAGIDYPVLLVPEGTAIAD